MYPSIKTIAARLRLDNATATTIRKLMDGRADPCEVSTAAADYLRSCYNPPDRVHLAMVAIDQLLGTHGVEYIKPEDISRTRRVWRTRAYFYQRGPLGVDYCNTGDSYADTVCYSHARQRYLIAGWAYFCE